MKKLISLIAAIALLHIQVGALAAANGVMIVIVRLELVDKLVLTGGGTITLDNADADPALGDTIGPDTDTTGLLHFVHNKNGNKKLTTEVTTAPDPLANDIILQLSVGGNPAMTLYNDAGSAAPQDVATGLAAGAFNNQSLAYTAQCTAAGTPIGVATDFSFTITYTSVDQ